VLEINVYAICSNNYNLKTFLISFAEVSKPALELQAAFLTPHYGGFLWLY
jgi:hypothetical protein